MKNVIENKKDRRPSAGGRRKKRIAAGTITGLLMLCLILGIFQGLRQEGEGQKQGQEEEKLLAEDEKDSGEEKTDIQKTGETDKGRIDHEISQTVLVPDQERVEGEKNTVIEKNNNAGENAGENEDTGKDTVNGLEGTKEPAEEETRHEVGDILEDGSMYTGGDVEAGLDYIRQNPQIWDQLVWH